MYYSGEISSDDYKALLSLLKEARDLSPELETECRIFLAIESCEPVLPNGFEKNLTDAIDKRFRRAKFFKKIIWEGIAAVILLICVFIGTFNHVNKELSATKEYVAKNSIATEKIEGIAMSGATSSEEVSISVNSLENTPTEKTSLHTIEESVITEINDEEFDNAVQTIDEALLNILSNIHMAQSEVEESLESIEINKTTDINI